MNLSRALNVHEGLGGNTLIFFNCRPGNDIKYIATYSLQGKDFLGTLSYHTCFSKLDLVSVKNSIIFSDKQAYS